MSDTMKNSLDTEVAALLRDADRHGYAVVSADTLHAIVSVAAAPELLDALRAGEAQIMECINVDNPRDWFENALATLETIRAAIARAEGGVK